MLVICELCHCSALMPHYTLHTIRVVPPVPVPSLDKGGGRR